MTDLPDGRGVGLGALSQIWDAQDDRDVDAQAMFQAIETEYADAQSSDALALDGAFDTEVPDSLDSDQQTLKVVPGDFVEVRRLGGSFIGVIVPHSEGFEAAREMICAVSIRGGQIEPFLESDIMFHLPAFVDTRLAKVAAPQRNEEISRGDTVGPPVTLAEIGSTEVLRARNYILTRLRSIDLAVDSEIRRILPAFQGEFLVDSKLTNRKDGDGKGKNTCVDNALTTIEVARRLCHITPTPSPISSGSSSRIAHAPLSGTRGASTSAVSAQPAPSPITLLAAHTLMMNHPEHFLADPRNHRVTAQFTRRDEAERMAWAQVRQWLAAEQQGKLSAFAVSKPALASKRHAPNNQRQADVGPEGPLAAFCRRARLVRKERQRLLALEASKPQSAPASPTSTPFARLTQTEMSAPHFEWTKEDQVILRFLLSAMESRRSIQEDIFTGMAMDIVKRAGGVQPLPTSDYVAGVDFESTEDDKIRRMQVRQMNAEIKVAQRLGLRSPALLSAGVDTAYAWMARFLVDIGVVAPWTNLQVVNPTMQRIIADERFQDSKHAADEKATVQPSTASVHRPHTSEELKRRDFGSLRTYVIDDASAHELDDGVSIEATSDPAEWWVHIHVADPASVISPNSQLAEFAERQGSTIYFPEARYPLLPDDNLMAQVDMGSLARRTSTQGAGQNVISFSARVNERTGKVSDYAVGASRISSVKVCTYSDVQDMFDDAAQAATLFEEEDRTALRTLRRITALLGAQRIKGGMFLNAAPSVSVKVSPLPLPDLSAPLSRPHLYTGLPQIDVEVQAPPKIAPGLTSESMVSELMILAGRVMGAWAAEHKVPMPYRAQVTQSQASTRHLSDVKADWMRSLSKLRDPVTGLVEPGPLMRGLEVMPRTTIGSRPMPHWSMGIQIADRSSASGDALSRAGYVRCTSPLRRYADLFVHWQLLSALRALQRGKAANSKLALDEEALRPELYRFQRQDRWVRDLQRASYRHWIGQHVARLLDLEAQGRHDEIREQDRVLLQPAPATIRLATVKAFRTLDGTVEVVAHGLGIPASCEWTRWETAPVVGETVMVKPFSVGFAGLRTQVVVRRV
ncbi:3'-5' RNA exonuclease complex component [Tilletia horrida]|nr:3'-5' RNA exonuclease complex component [Tilletia horrida]